MSLNVKLTMPLSMEEFHLATKSMAKNKSLSQDGVVIGFHLLLWEIIGKEFNR
jgi:hypothetical protein